MARVTGGTRIVAALSRYEPAVVRVGFLSNARYPDGKPVAMIAAIQEYGAPSVGIPPRPFFRNMIAAKQSEWPAAIRSLLKSTGNDAVRTLDLAGASIAGQLRESIINTNTPPNAPSTIARKGSSKPLVHTRDMLKNINHEVIRGRSATP